METEDAGLGKHEPTYTWTTSTVDGCGCCNQGCDEGPEQNLTTRTVDECGCYNQGCDEGPKHKQPQHYSRGGQCGSQAIIEIG